MFRDNVRHFLDGRKGLSEKDLHFDILKRDPTRNCQKIIKSLSGTLKTWRSESRIFTAILGPYVHISIHHQTDPRRTAKLKIKTTTTPTKTTNGSSMAITLLTSRNYTRKKWRIEIGFSFDVTQPHFDLIV